MKLKYEEDCYELFIDKNEKCSMDNRYNIEVNWPNECWLMSTYRKGKKGGKGREGGGRRGGGSQEGSRALSRAHRRLLCLALA